MSPAANSTDENFRCRRKSGLVRTYRRQASYICSIETRFEGKHTEGALLLRAGDKNYPNLFLFHEVSGQVDAYTQLCGRLESQLTVYGLAASPLPDLSPADLSLPRMAAEYVETIVRQQGAGPYLLAGHSLGGTIAFEAALQLESRGREVAFLGLLDSPSPLAAVKEKQIEFTTANEIEFLSSFLRRPAAALDVTEHMSIGQIWNAVLDYLQREDIDPAVIRRAIEGHGAYVLPDYQNPTRNELLSLLNMIRSLRNGRANYRPASKLDAPLTYFQAADTTAPRAAEEWGQFCIPTITVIQVPGNHASMLKSPHVQTLATLFDRTITSILRS